MLRYLFPLILLVFLDASYAHAERRIALIIGNGAYGNIGRLDNPPADARLMARTLGALGFEVTSLIDADQTTMKRSIVDFGRDLRAAGRDTVGLFYYAGHGIQASGKNYLIPTEVDLRHEADLDVGAVEANWVLRQMESAGNATNIVILDACRNNPFARSFRSATRGLAQMDAPTGSFIAYATAPGDVAVDGATGNSPYTSALAAALNGPSAPIEQMFKRVRIEVIEATQGRQTPWDSSSLIDDFSFQGLEDGVSADGVSGEPAEHHLWMAVKESRDIRQVELFLSVYQSGPFSDEARALLRELRAESGTEPPRPGEKRAEELIGGEPRIDSGTVRSDPDPDGGNPHSQSPSTQAGPDNAETVQAETPDPKEAIGREQALDLSHSDIREIQRRLTLLGLDPKGVDGILGKGSRRAIALWQALNDFAQTGYLDSAQRALLESQTEAAYASWSRTAGARSSGRARPAQRTGRYIDSDGCMREADGRIVVGFKAGCD